MTVAVAVTMTLIVVIAAILTAVVPVIPMPAAALTVPHVPLVASFPSPVHRDLRRNVVVVVRHAHRDEVAALAIRNAHHVAGVPLVLAPVPVGLTVRRPRVALDRHEPRVDRNADAQADIEPLHP